MVYREGQVNKGNSTHTPMVTWSLTNKLRPFSGKKKTAFTTNGARLIGVQHVEENKLIHFYHLTQSSSPSGLMASHKIRNAQ